MSSNDYEGAQEDPRVKYFKTGAAYGYGPGDHRRGYPIDEDGSPPPETPEPHVDTHGFFEIPAGLAEADIDEAGPIGYHAPVVRPTEDDITASQRLVERSRESQGKVTTEELAILALVSAGKLRAKFSLSKKPPKPKKTI